MYHIKNINNTSLKMNITPPEIQNNIYIAPDNRVEELNTRILHRTNISTNLMPNFDPRPTPTKYSLFPNTDVHQRPINVASDRKYLDYYPEVIFYPGNSKAPVSGFLNNIDIETDLRNQNIPLHKSDLPIQYIPSKTSDLYQTVVPGGSLNEPQPYPLLFEQYSFSQSIHPNIQPNIGTNTFYNHTRTQLRNM